MFTDEIKNKSEKGKYQRIFSLFFLYNVYNNNTIIKSQINIYIHIYKFQNTLFTNLFYLFFLQIINY